MSNSGTSFWRPLLAAFALTGAVVALACTTEDVDVTEDTPDAAINSGGAAGGGGVDPVCTSEGAICDCKVAAGTSMPLITDFEGLELGEFGVAFTVTSAGIMTGTYKYNEESLPAANAVFALVAGPSSATALETSFIDSVEWGGGMGFWIDGCVDATVFDGIAFWARGFTPSGTALFALQTGNTRTVAEGGTCPDAGPCAAPHTNIILTNTWTEFRLAWSDFADGDSGGMPAPATGDQIVGLEWTLAGTYNTPETLVIALDDLAFYTE